MTVTAYDPSVAGPRSFYDGSTPERTLRTCPKCRRPEDPEFPHTYPAGVTTAVGCAVLGRVNAGDRAERAERERWQQSKIDRARAKRDAGRGRATSSDPAGHDRAVEIIRAAAEKLPAFSANAVREAMTEANVKPTLVAGAFRSAVADKTIAATDRTEPSLAESTNAHRLMVYRSLVFGAA